MTASPGGPLTRWRGPAGGTAADAAARGILAYARTGVYADENQGPKSPPPAPDPGGS